MEQHRYRLADFELASEFVLPLPVAPSASTRALPEVQVCTGEAAALPAPRARRVLLQVAPDDYRLEIPGVACYRVRAGSQIVVQPAPGVPLRTVAAYLCSYALAALCCQRGLLVVHATAVACAGRAVLLLGRSGCGKSTLGASLVARGARLLSEDLCVIDTAGPVVQVLPSAQSFSLWPDSAAHLGYAISESLQPIAGVPKCRVDIGCSAASATPVHSVLVLGEATPALAAADCTALPLLAALASLAGGAGLGALLQGMGREYQHLEQCRQLLGQARAWQVARCASFAQLPDLAQLTEQLAMSPAAQHGLGRDARALSWP